jgi:hypothetical protein
LETLIPCELRRLVVPKPGIGHGRRRQEISAALRQIIGRCQHAEKSFGVVSRKSLICSERDMAV